MTTPPPRSARVQSATVRLRGAFVEQRFGVDARQRYVASASPPLRALLLRDAKAASTWVDFDLFVEATVLADKLFGRGDLGLAWEIGRFAATHEVGVWKNLLMRHIRPTLLLSIASGAWNHHYDGGRLVSRATGANSVLVSIEGFPSPHRAHCQSIAGWMFGSLELGPRKDCRVDEVQCRARGGSACEFKLTWAG